MDGRDFIHAIESFNFMIFCVSMCVDMEISFFIMRGATIFLTLLCWLWLRED